MKKGKSILGGIAFLFAMALSFVSCSIDNDEGCDYNNSYLDIAAVVTSGDSCYFIGSGGEKYIPTPKYTNTNNIKSSAIVFRILSDESTSQAKQFHIQLYQDPVKLDATVDSAPTVAKLDSVKNDSILDFNPVYYINNQYLVMAINYNIDTKLHYFTLCYAADKGFVTSGSKNVPDTLKFTLRHNANNDAASQYTSYYLYHSANKISCYCKGFDIGSILSAAYKQSGKSTMYIDIQAKTHDDGSRVCTISHNGFTYPLSSSSKTLYEGKIK